MSVKTDPLYDQMFRRLEKARWQLADIPFKSVDKSRVSAETLQSLRANCLMELSSLYAQRMFMRDFKPLPDFCQFTSIWYYEEMKHYLVLREYLKVFEMEPDVDVFSELDTELSESPWPATLALHFCGELRLGIWYHRWSELAEEPVLGRIYRLIGNDEFRHAGCYKEFMAQALASDADLLLDFLQASKWMLVNPNRDKHPTTMKADRDGDSSVTDRIEGYEAMFDRIQHTITDEHEQDLQRKVLATMSQLANRPLRSLMDLVKLTTELRDGQVASRSTSAAA